MTKQSPSEAVAYDICLKLQNAGYEAYWSGGCVRDQYLGLPPKDYDIATSAHPDQVETLFSKTLAIGKSFGVMAVIENEIQTDVATFRADAPLVMGAIRMPLLSVRQQKMPNGVILQSMHFSTIRSQKSSLIM